MATPNCVQPLVLGLNRHPTSVVCPICRCYVVTELKYKTGFLNYLLCFLCILFGCVLGCCLIPLIINRFKDVEHVCPNCNSIIGRYKRLTVS